MIVMMQVRPGNAPVIREEVSPVALPAGFLSHACNQLVHLLCLKSQGTLPDSQAVGHLLGLSDPPDCRVVCGDLGWAKASTKASTCRRREFQAHNAFSGVRFNMQCSIKAIFLHDRCLQASEGDGSL
jgi:hypothetical protein